MELEPGVYVWKERDGLLFIRDGSDGIGDFPSIISVHEDKLVENHGVLEDLSNSECYLGRVEWLMSWEEFFSIIGGDKL